MYSKEELINFGERFLKMTKGSEHGVSYEFFEEALKLFKQESVLDKVRAEIKQMDFDFGDFYDHTDSIREMVLEVIDKYKAGE